MLISYPLVGTPELERKRAELAQRIIDCTRTPDDALLNAALAILDKRIFQAEQEIKDTQARYPAKSSVSKSPLKYKAR